MKAKSVIIFIFVIALFILFFAIKKMPAKKVTSSNDNSSAIYSDTVKEKTNSNSKKQENFISTARTIDPGDFDDPFENPANNDPNQYFSSKQFDSWVTLVSFSDNYSPNYSFENGTWDLYNETNSSYRVHGKDTTGGGHTITDITYYLYKSKNPLFSPTNTYNTGRHGEKINRFNFYRFTGWGDGIQPLNNMLIAVDRYTKLIFLFAIPTNFEHIFGKKIPISWGSVDSIAQNGKYYKFYEYDPVGIVRSNGSVELYEWYINSVENGNYTPVINFPIGDIATYNSPGRSPYYNLYASATDEN